MAKKHKRAREVLSHKCQAIVNYVYYPERGVRTVRHGRCGGWSYHDCGFCRRHCRKFCTYHKIMWKIIDERRTSARAS